MNTVIDLVHFSFSKQLITDEFDLFSNIISLIDLIIYL